MIQVDAEHRLQTQCKHMKGTRPNEYVMMLPSRLYCEDMHERLKTGTNIADGYCDQIAMGCP
jgi:hypothetical protein